MKTHLLITCIFSLQFSILLSADLDNINQEILTKSDTAIECSAIDTMFIIKKNSSLEEDTLLYLIVDKMPRFRGGETEKFQKFVYRRLKYPKIARENGITGTVMVSFTINEEGNVEDVKIIESVDPVLDKEALRVVKLSPPWTPGECGNTKVKVTYMFPIVFVSP
jgi:periplasmic protein TonB